MSIAIFYTPGGEEISILWAWWDECFGGAMHVKSGRRRLRGAVHLANCTVLEATIGDLERIESLLPLEQHRISVAFL